MLDDSQARASSSREIPWLSAVQFGLSALAAVTIAGLALSLGLAGAQLLIDSNQPEAAVALWMMAASFFWTALIVLPSAGFSLARLIGRPVPPANWPFLKVRWTLAIFLLPPLIALGNLLARQALPWKALLAGLHPVVVAIPVLWVCAAAIRGLPVGSLQRASGSLASGAALGTSLSFFLEVLAIAAVLVLWVMALAGRPELIDEISSLTRRLEAAAPIPETIQRILLPYLSQPPVIFTIFFLVAVLIPLIEELAKTAGLWLLAGRSTPITPAAGFALGALSGGGFAMLESMLLTSSPEQWMIVILARLGTTAMHICTSALVGWGLACAWSEGRYARLGAAYLSAALLHGAWNAFSMLNAAGSLSNTNGGAALPGLWLQASRWSPAGMTVLALGSFALLLWANAIFRRHLAAGADPDVLRASTDVV